MKLQQICGQARRRVPPASILRPGLDLSAAMFLLALAGCGMPGAPQPPSLNLPVPVANLTAVRAGDQVALAWKEPLRNTDKILLKGPIATRICRNDLRTGPCNAVTILAVPPGADATFTDTLPPNLASGSPRPLSYFVELVNRNSRSAGLSNSAVILAGQAPAAVDGFSAELRKDGVLLRWTPPPPDAPPAAIRFQRTLLTPPSKKSSQNSPQGSLAAPAEPVQRNLLVETGSASRALDSEIHFGESYEYRAQRVVRVDENGQTLEISSPLSAPIRIDAEDIFPPTIPQGLAAVATAGENGNPPAVDLSWLPDADAGLAGYIVYRRELGTPLDSSSSAGTENPAAWQRISPAQPVIGPGFHDSNVQTGHSYMYAVSAIGQNGHESERSVPADETVPEP
jgi:hypothetical protein